MQSQFRLNRIYSLIIISLMFYSSASDGDHSWQPVQNNMRLGRGDYQIGTPTEDSCKDRCIRNPDCIGVDWHTGSDSCLLLYDSSASPYHAAGYRHWRITRNRPTLITSQRTATPTATPATTATSATVQNDISIATTVKSVVSEQVFTTQTAATLASSTTKVRSATTIVTPGQNLSVEKVFPVQKSDTENGKQLMTDADESYSWQPVHHNMRTKNGDYQTGTTNATSCKAHCVQNPDCIGIDWHAVTSSCFLLYDCSAPSFPEVGYKHWEVRRYKRIPMTCQDIVRRVEPSSHPSPQLLVLCNSQEKLQSVVRVLSALLCVATVIIFALLFNTCRLYRKMRNCACKAKKVNFAYKPTKENGYQSYTSTPNQSAGYQEIARTAPSDSDNLYDAIDDVLRQLEA